MSYVYDYSKLLGRLREKQITQSELASKLGISETTLNFSLKNKRPFKQSEINQMCEILSIPLNSIEVFFLPNDFRYLKQDKNAS